MFFFVVGASDSDRVLDLGIRSSSLELAPGILGSAENKI
jgi:hypothetical protein